MNLICKCSKIIIPSMGLVIILIVTAAYSLIESIKMHQEVESIVILWSLATGLYLLTIWNQIKKTIQTHDIILSWIFLICSGGTLILTNYINDSFAIQISLLFLMGSCLARFTNYQNVFKLFTSGTIFLIILPNSTYFNSLISYPLRLICSHLTCFSLKLCTVDITCNATTLMLGSEKIAVTAACSGIAQLEAMLFIAWIITIMTHKRLICRISHYLLLLPILILLNSLRLTITLLLYLQFGEVVFNDTVHISLGYAMIVMITIAFWSCRSLIPFSEKYEENK